MLPGLHPTPHSGAHSIVRPLAGFEGHLAGREGKTTEERKGARGEEEAGVVLLGGLMPLSILQADKAKFRCDVF